MFALNPHKKRRKVSKGKRRSKRTRAGKKRGMARLRLTCRASRSGVSALAIRGKRRATKSRRGKHRRARKAAPWVGLGSGTVGSARMGSHNPRRRHGRRSAFNPLKIVGKGGDVLTMIASVAAGYFGGRLIGEQIAKRAPQLDSRIATGAAGIGMSMIGGKFLGKKSAIPIILGTILAAYKPHLFGGGMPKLAAVLPMPPKPPAMAGMYGDGDYGGPDVWNRH